MATKKTTKLPSARQTSALNTKVKALLANVQKVGPALTKQNTKFKNLEKTLLSTLTKRVKLSKDVLKVQQASTLELTKQMNRMKAMVRMQSTMTTSSKNYATNITKAAASIPKSVRGLGLGAGGINFGRGAGGQAMAGGVAAAMVAAYQAQATRLNQQNSAFTQRQNQIGRGPNRRQRTGPGGTGLLHNINRLRDMRDDMHDINRGDALDKAANFLDPNGPGRGKIAAVALGSAAAVAAKASWGALGDALTVVKKTFFAVWDYIDTKVLPTQALLNRSIGASTLGIGDLRKQAFATGQQFQNLGLEFAQGAKLVADLGKALYTTKISNSDLKNLKTMAEYVGIGADQTGKLALAYRATGRNVGVLTADLKQVALAAGEYEIPVQSVMQEFADNIPAQQRWGIANAREFGRAIVRAQSLGIEYKKLDAAFGEQMDTFEAVSDSANKLNQVFGTNLNSIALLNATDGERLDMFQKAFTQVGIVFDKLDPKYQNVITQTTHLDRETAALAFGSEEFRKKQKALNDEKDRSQRIDKEWNKSLENVRLQLISVPQIMENFFISISNVIGRLLDFKDGQEAVTTGVKGFETWMRKVTDRINEFSKTVDGHTLEKVKNWFVNAEQNAEKFLDTIERVADALLRVANPYDSWRGEANADTFMHLPSMQAKQNWLKENWNALDSDKQYFFKKAVSKDAGANAQLQAYLSGMFENKVTPNAPLPTKEEMDAKTRLNQANSQAFMDMLSGMPDINVTVSSQLDGQQVGEAAAKATVRGALGAGGGAKRRAPTPTRKTAYQ